MDTIFNNPNVPPGYEDPDPGDVHQTPRLQIVPNYDIAITGGLGFIGTALVDHLSPKDVTSNILVLDHQRRAIAIPHRSVRPGVRNLFHAGCDIVEDSDSLCRRFRGVHTVYHLAAASHSSIEDNEQLFKTNVMGTMNVLNAAMECYVKKIVVLSSSEIYGSRLHLRQREDETALRPRNPYAASKASADLLAQSYMVRYGAPIVVLRPCNAFGPGQTASRLIPTLIRAALENAPLTVYGGGKCSREWIYIDDLVRAIATAAELPAGVYNIGSNQTRSVHRVAEEILKRIPESTSTIEERHDLYGQDTQIFLSSEKFITACRGSWHPEVSFEAGLDRTIKDYRLL